MAKKRNSGSAAGIGGAAAIVCAVLALSGNFGTVMDTIADQFPTQDAATSSPSTTEATASGEANVTDEGTVEVTIPSAVTAPAPARARDLLADLPTSERVKESDSTYERDDYGEAWTDVDGNGCSQRQDVLHVWLVKDEPSDVRTKDSCDHEVYGGTWHDPYTGRAITLTEAKDQKQAQTVQIDHIVPLKEAHESGARDWTNDRKTQFANDTTNLVPVYGPVNSSKGGDDAAAWRPRKEHQCDYARRYISVKAKWDLSVDTAERDALTEMLDTCVERSGQ